MIRDVRTKRADGRETKIDLDTGYRQAMTRFSYEINTFSQEQNSSIEYK